MRADLATIFTSQIHTPLGYMGAVADNDGLLRLDWQQSPLSYDSAENDVSRETISQIKAYLSATLTHFSLPVSPSATTPALSKWLAAISSVPFGKTVSYCELAGLWGNPKAARAAGNACQKNPLPLIIPCHRIIATNGAFISYSGGDRSAPNSPANIARKKALLDFEAGLIGSLMA